MTEIPDDVVELAAEAYAKMQGWPPDYAVTDGWRERRHSTMRHVLSLPEVRAALAPSPVPVVSQAERLAKVQVAAMVEHDDRWRKWEAQTERDKASFVAAAQALIDDGTIPPEPVPDVAEMLARALRPRRDEVSGILSWGEMEHSMRREAIDRVRALMADGWQFTPPPLGTEKGGE